MPILLVIEQDENIRKQLIDTAELNGYSAISSSTLEEARLKLQRCAPSIVLASKELIYAHHRDLITTSDIGKTTWLIFSSSWPLSVREEFQAQGCRTLYLEITEISETLSALPSQSTAETSSTALDKLRGNSQAIQDLKTQIRKASPTSLSVFLIGESGTGKELVAHAIHKLSGRHAKPYTALNCGAIPESLIESELFGHEKGSFTGADRQRIGVFEQCQDGTLFLDEITEMAPALQVRLLRVLESGEYYRLGGTEKKRSQVRVIAATNTDPEHALKQGKLRLDLYYRLAVLPLYLPPLRERIDDIPILVSHFLNRLAHDLGEKKQLSPGAMLYLQDQSWPGNIRQLRNEISRAYVLTDGNLIDRACFMHPLAPRPC